MTFAPGDIVTTRSDITAEEVLQTLRDIESYLDSCIEDQELPENEVATIREWQRILRRFRL